MSTTSPPPAPKLRRPTYPPTLSWVWGSRASTPSSDRDPLEGRLGSVKRRPMELPGVDRGDAQESDPV
jgi:hypothetical protein